MYKLSRLPQAEDDLFGIADYVEAEFGARVVARLLADFERTFDMIAFMPGIGSQVDFMPKGVRSKVGMKTARSFIVYFLFENDQVEIMRIIHGARDQDSALREVSDDDET